MSQNKNASSNLRRKLKESQTALENINPLVFTPDSIRFATEVLTHFSPTMFHFHTPWKCRERKSRAENSIGQPKTLRVTIKVTHYFAGVPCLFCTAMICLSTKYINSFVQCILPRNIEKILRWAITCSGHILGNQV